MIQTGDSVLVLQQGRSQARDSAAAARSVLADVKELSEPSASCARTGRDLKVHMQTYMQVSLDQPERPLAKPGAVQKSSNYVKPSRYPHNLKQ